MKWFLALARGGLPAAGPIAEQRVDAVVRKLMEKMPGPNLDKIEAWLRRSSVERHMARANAYLDAASLIFAHSITDEVVSATIKLAATIDPDAWESSIIDRKVPLAKVKDHDYGAIRHEALMHHLARLDRESLPKRVEVLFSICPPTDRRTGEARFAVDLPRLRALDKLRQDVVHGHKMGAPLGIGDEDADFLDEVGWLALMAVRHRYAERMTPEHMGDFPVLLDAPPAVGPSEDRSTTQTAE